VEVLFEFFKITWEVCSTHQLKDGAIDVIITLFNQLPSQAKKVSQFFASRVFVHATNDDKVEQSAWVFLRLIQGDISRFTNDSDDALSSINCKGSFEESWANTFLIVFFRNQTSGSTGPSSGTY
jgi:hypothetical protein